MNTHQNNKNQSQCKVVSSFIVVLLAQISFAQTYTPNGTNTAYITYAGTGVTTTSGTWSVPCGVSQFTVWAVGGGGGGGGDATALYHYTLTGNDDYANYAGGGGEGGDYETITVTSGFTAGTTNYNYSIGGGGTGGSGCYHSYSGLGADFGNCTASNGGAGGTTSLGVLLSANGGHAGTGAYAENQTNISGGSGLNGSGGDGNGNGGGGATGGAGGAAGAGASVTASGSTPGTAIISLPGQVSANFNGKTMTTSCSGGLYGGGGGGASAVNSGNTAGCNGNPGILVIQITCNAPNAGAALPSMPQCQTSGAMGGDCGTWSGGAGTWTNPADAANATYTAGSSESGVVTLTLTNACGMTATKNITITPHTAPFAGNDGSYCTDGTIQLHANGGNAYSWSGPNGFTATGSDPTASAAAYGGGTYSVTVTGAGGCTGTATTIVTVNGTIAPTNVTANAAPSPVCPGTTVNLTGSATGAVSYSWSSSPAGFNAAVQNTSAAPNVNTTYTLVATNACGSTSATASVSVTNVPAVISGVTAICAGSNTQLTANQGVSGYNYQWNDAGNSITQSITVSTAGNYGVTVTGNGCSATASAQVLSSANPVIALNASYTSCCQAVVLNATPDSSLSYIWSNSDTTRSLTVQGGATAENQAYSVTAVNAAGCTATASTVVNIYCVKPTATAVPPTIVSGQTNTINVTTNYGLPTDFTYEWTPTATLNNSTGSSAVSNATSTTTYTIVVTDPVAGCTDSAVVTLSALPANATPFAMPTAFTPNGDHINDTYFPVLPAGTGSVTAFRIYDRWGKLLYDNPSQGWDGKYSGQEQAIDTYSYFVTVKSIDLNNPTQFKEYQKEGSFTLLR